MENFTLRIGTVNDLASLQELFAATVKTICIQDYTVEQVEVWSSSIENRQRWSKMIKEQYVIVALKNNTIVGFCTLDKGTYIDLLFVHKDYQGQKIAYHLYKNIENESKRRKTKQLWADVSKTAKPFFEKMGFLVIKEQIVVLQNVEFINYKMSKKINTA